MSIQACQYARIRSLMATDPDLEQFSHRLACSPVASNRYYLGLLMMAIVALPKPKIEHLRALVKHGADVNFMQPASEDGKSVLMVACEKSVVENVLFLLSFEHLQVGLADAQGNNVLDYALRNTDQTQSISIMTAILKQFPHLAKTQNRSGRSLLFSAIQQQKLRVLEFLIAGYLDVNQQMEPTGMTCLHYSISQSGQICQSMLKQLLVLLLEFGADPKIRNYLNQDSFDYADKYLLDLHEIVGEVQQRDGGQCAMRKGYKCDTMQTYADTRTVFSKEDEEPMVVDGDGEQSREREQGRDLDEQFMALQGEYQQQVDSFEHEPQACDSQVKQMNVEQFHADFSSQIWAYYLSSQDQYSKAWSDISPMWEFMQQLGAKYQLSVDLIGSFGTGLWTPHSDIDIVFINEKPGYVDIHRLLSLIHADIARQTRHYNIAEIYLNDCKFPNIKLKLMQAQGSRRIELAIFQIKCSGRKYVHYVKQCLTVYPVIAPLYFVLHRLLQMFDLHRPTRNGIKTYTLFLMILDSVRVYSGTWLSQYFINFMQYYLGNQSTFIMQAGSNVQTKITLSVLDPLNSGFNTGGKDADAGKLITLLKSALFTIGEAGRDGNSCGLLQTLFQVHSMHS